MMTMDNQGPADTVGHSNNASLSISNKRERFTGLHHAHVVVLMMHYDADFCDCVEPGNTSPFIQEERTFYTP
jgi:hypothetical protein